MFYFHAIEEDNKIKDFPFGILDSKTLVIYSGGRSKPLHFTGYYANIKSIDLKHKSKIKHKEKSTTEYYHEIILDGVFKKDEALVGELNIKTLFDSLDKINPQLIKQYLPAITTWDKIGRRN